MDILWGGIILPTTWADMFCLNWLDFTFSYCNLELIIKCLKPSVQNLLWSQATVYRIRFFFPPAPSHGAGVHSGPSMWTHWMWVYPFHLSWAPWEELLETLPYELLGRALGERMQRKEVNIPCKDKQLSDFKELGISESGSREQIAVPHCSHHSVKSDSLSLCWPNCCSPVPLFFVHCTSR